MNEKIILNAEVPQGSYRQFSSQVSVDFPSFHSILFHIHHISMVLSLVSLTFADVNFSMRLFLYYS